MKVRLKPTSAASTGHPCTQDRAAMHCQPSGAQAPSPGYISPVTWPNVSGGVGGEWIYFKVAGITHWQAFNLDGIHLRAYGKRMRVMMSEINTPAGGAQVYFQNLDGTWWGFSSAIPLGPDFNFDPNVYGPLGLGPFQTMLIASVEGAKEPPAVDDVYLNPLGIGL